MFKKVVFALFLIFSLILLMGAVSGAEVIGSDFKNTPPNSMIKEVKLSKQEFKAGTNVAVKVRTSKSIKSVSGYVAGNSYKFKKNKQGIWYSNLKTNKYNTGIYSLKIIAVDGRKKVYRSNAYFSVDNIPPRIISSNSNVTSVTGGDPVFIETITDKSSKKVVAKVGGKTFYFRQNNIDINNNRGLTNSNANNWTLNAKIGLENIGNLAIVIYAYDSVGNVDKKTLYIKSTPRYAFWNGTVLHNKPIRIYYSYPVDDYQRSINYLNKYVTVYEGYAGSFRTLGITYYVNKKPIRVIIAYKDPFVVYHELAHVLNWRWSEYQCDLYAYKNVGYWIL